MKNIFLLILLVSSSLVSKSQINALTEDGREVLLFNNGTWKFSNDSLSKAESKDSLILNKNKFTRSTNASFLVKSKVMNVGVYMNPAKWTFEKSKENEATPEYKFNLKNGEGYSMLITEKIEIDLENLRDIALMNAQKASLDVKETFAEYRMVNNLKVLCLKMEGTIKGIKFVYFGYYYSNENGTVQFVSFASKKSFVSLQKDLETFLNGLVEIEK